MFDNVFLGEFIKVTSEDLGFTEDDIFNKRSLSNEIYSKLGRPQGIITIDGRKILPYKLSVIIMYRSEEALEQLFIKELCKSCDEDQEFNRERYESAAVKVRDYYNQFIYFYNDEFDKYLKTHI